MALATSLPPDTASKVAAPLQIDWQDQEWMSGRRERQQHSRRCRSTNCTPARGSVSWTIWAKSLASTTGAELAERLIPYVQELGFTHIELMPIMEHPFGGRGAINAVAVRPERALRHPESSPSSSTPVTRPNRRDPRLGAGAFSRPIPMAWRNSTALRCTNTPTRWKASIRTGTR
jgi:hypothetical protein